MTTTRATPEIDTPDPLTLRVVAALADESMPAADLRTLLAECGARRRDVEQRYVEIRPGGRERGRVELAGTPAALSALHRASELARLELAQREAQMAALTVAREGALNREASEGLPALVADLENVALTRVENVLDDLAAALPALQKCIGAVAHARVRAINARLPAASADPSVAARLAKIHDRCGQAAALSTTRHLHETAASLGAVEKREGAPA